MSRTGDEVVGNDEFYKDDDGESNVWDMALHLLLVVALPAVAIIVASCFCCRNRKSLADTIRERLENERRIPEAIQSIDPVVLHGMVLNVILPPHPPKAFSATAGLATNTKYNASEADDVVTAIDTQDVGMLVVYDKETKWYKWINRNSDDSRVIGLGSKKKSSHKSCSICLEAFEDAECSGRDDMGRNSKDGAATIPGDSENVPAVIMESDQAVCDCDQYTETSMNVMFVSRCGHPFHLHCILGWIHNKHGRNANNNIHRDSYVSSDRDLGESCCPYCRQPLWEDGIYKTLQGDMALQLFHHNQISQTTTELHQHVQQHPEASVADVVTTER